MSKKIGSGRLGPWALLCALFAFGAMNAAAQNGQITPRLATAKFALMKGWWGTDHDATTPGNFRYIVTLAASKGISIDTFNLNTSTTPLSQANLDKYDVIMWYNVYRMYEHIDSAIGNRIQRWYENGNKGLSCFHQCVRHSGWTWWGDMMGREYNTYAGVTTGPVYIDSQALSSVYSGQYTAGQSFSFNDEWYVYVGNPRGTTGTKMLWTTKRSAFPASGFNMPTGEDQPVAWIREYRGGRFALNGMFHTNVIASSTSATLRPFFDSTMIGTMRFLAGYTGCKDSNYVEYNQKATHQGTNTCVTPRGTSSVWTPDAVDGKIRMDAFKIVFSQPGAHSVEVFDARGGKVASHRGEGSREYSFTDIRQPGIYYMKILTAGMKAPLTRRFILL